MQYQREAKSAARLHRSLVWRTNLFKAVDLLQSKYTTCLMPNQLNCFMVICNWFDWQPLVMNK